MDLTLASSQARLPFARMPRANQVGAGALLILAAPVMLIAAVALLLAGPGEVIRQEPYLGCNGRLGYRRVFRTTAPFTPERFDADPALYSRVGTVIRRLGIWRLPELLDVALGPRAGTE